MTNYGWPVPVHGTGGRHAVSPRRARLLPLLPRRIFCIARGLELAFARSRSPRRGLECLLSGRADLAALLPSSLQRKTGSGLRRFIDQVQRANANYVFKAAVADRAVVGPKIVDHLNPPAMGFCATRLKNTDLPAASMRNTHVKMGTIVPEKRSTWGRAVARTFLP